MNAQVIKILKESDALLEGHFLLSSGLHSDRYIQCAKALRFPSQAEKIMKIVAEKIKNMPLDMIVGPAMGGIITAYELARQLNLEAIFTERVNGKMQLRRGFSIQKGTHVLISEDVITTGKSTREVQNLMEDMGGIVMGVACIADRRPKDLDFGLSVYSAIQLDINIYSPEQCPLCRANLPLIKPGSRQFK